MFIQPFIGLSSRLSGTKEIKIVRCQYFEIIQFIQHLRFEHFFNIFFNIWPLRKYCHKNTCVWVCDQNLSLLAAIFVVANSLNVHTCLRILVENKFVEKAQWIFLGFSLTHNMWHGLKYTPKSFLFGKFRMLLAIIGISFYQFAYKIISKSSYTEKTSYFWLYELIQDLPYYISALNPTCNLLFACWKNFKKDFLSSNEHCQKFLSEIRLEG